MDEYDGKLRLVVLPDLLRPGHRRRRGAPRAPARAGRPARPARELERPPRPARAVREHPPRGRDLHPEHHARSARSSWSPRPPATSTCSRAPCSTSTTSRTSCASSTWSSASSRARSRRRSSCATRSGSCAATPSCSTEARQAGRIRDESGKLLARTSRSPTMGRTRLDHLEALPRRHPHRARSPATWSSAAPAGAAARIFLRGYLDAYSYEMPNRQVWVADRFRSALAATAGPTDDRVDR